MLDRRLRESRFLTVEDYSIADISACPWMVIATTGLAGTLVRSLADDPLRRWLDEIGGRAAVQRAMASAAPD